jgi:hypothetical protein
MPTTRRSIRRPARVIAAAIALVLGPIVAAPGAQAALSRSERPLLAEFLEGVFDRRATTTTLNCVAGRLPSGAMTDLLADAIFSSGDTSALADSIPFRKVFRAVFACKPSEMVPGITSELSGAGLTSRQRTCFARNLLGRFAIDDELLTLAIRGGLQGLSFAGEDSILARNGVAALAGCVPASKIAGVIESLAASS